MARRYLLIAALLPSFRGLRPSAASRIPTSLPSPPSAPVDLRLLRARISFLTFLLPKSNAGRSLSPAENQLRQGRRGLQVLLGNICSNLPNRSASLNHFSESADQIVYLALSSQS